MFCKKCGVELPDKSNYCFNCGQAQNGFIESSLSKQVMFIDVMGLNAIYIKGTHEDTLKKLYDCSTTIISTVNPKGLKYRVSPFGTKMGFSPIEKKDNFYGFCYIFINARDDTARHLDPIIRETLILNGWQLQPITKTGYFTNYIYLKDM